jgi:hypothetical protein
MLVYERAEAVPERSDRRLLESGQRCHPESEPLISLQG